jgi:hypothetical protein
MPSVRTSPVHYLEKGKLTTDTSTVTGCIRPETLDRLNSNDGGGQYDSSGGAGGNGNPAGSKCLGFVLCCVSLARPLLTFSCTV